ncbi:nuclear factor of activated T cells 3 isoform X2 [Leptinotarsa decemlineata]|uniref:nuclear factor of activated T cells 3 isoform X2 n=1 Tax=Leptinotarsa decemlineata TaxID=7539 RepID=UPI003D30A1F9
MPQKRVSKPSTTGKRVVKQGRVLKPIDEDDPKKDEKSKASTSADSTGPKKNDKTSTTESNEPKKNDKTKTSTTESSTSESKMTLCTAPTVSSRPTRRPGRPPSGKSCAGVNRSREISAKVRSTYRRSLDPCDNSNDSGLGFGDHHMDPHHHTMVLSERLAWTGERAEAKRPKLDIKVEHDEINDRYCFPEAVRTCKDNLSLIRTAPAGTVSSLSMSNNPAPTSGRAVPRCIPLTSRQQSAGPILLTTQLQSSSQCVEASLTILKQPEQQHRARYQTEGSRGAVKDREGNGFPIVQLTGYYKPATLQVFIGTDIGKVSPHMFYQACKVSGKNSTPCVEKKIDGTCVIELQLDPSKEMSATCDCVGILKERNVDVEHRFPDQLGNRSKKKSTRCRMIFRTTITLDDGTQETLQVCSQPIVCTQPPGIPEICKKSLTSCPASGGLELFVLGKNFLKDTKVIFQQFEDGQVRWEQAVSPDKEYLQQTHFVCVVPPYRRPDITEPVSVRLCVVSSGKTSESHQFVYTPVNGSMPSVHMDPPSPSQQRTFFKSNFWQQTVNKREQDLDMMPPPESSLVPTTTRRPSINLTSVSDVHSPPLHSLKQEYIDESSEGSTVDQERYRHLSESSLDVHHGDSNMSMINENSIDLIHQNSMMSHMNENSNISVGNENSMDIMVRRNSLSRPSMNNDDSLDVMIHTKSMNRQSSICENSVDCTNSNMSAIDDDNSCCSTTMRNTVPSDRPILSQHSGLLTSCATTTLETVMDLRMKLPMATVADLVNTTAPSIAALQRFGMENSTGPLPNQSGQSVESYLTGIEAKPCNVPLGNPTGILMKNDLSEKLAQIISAESNIYQSQKLHSMSSLLSNTGMCTTKMPEGEPVFLRSPRPFMSSVTQSESINTTAKSNKSVDIVEQSIPERTNTAVSSTLTTISNTLDRSCTTPINTERLDALVNSTVESHLSPTRADSSPKDLLITNTLPLVSKNSSSAEVIISSQDIMLNSQTNLMVPPMINTGIPSPIISQQEMTNTHASPNLTSEVILNSQISPSLMCRNTNGLQQDGLLPATNLNLCQPTSSVDPGLLPAISSTQQSLIVSNASQNSTEGLNLHSPISVSLASEPEKALLINAAVDFLETQKKINELGTNLPSTTSNNNLNQMQNVGNNFSQAFSDASVMRTEQKTDFVIPIPVKDISISVQQDKKNEDRMIPQSFTSLTENELINFINPSCFDQV